MKQHPNVSLAPRTFWTPHPNSQRFSGFLYCSDAVLPSLKDLQRRLTALVNYPPVGLLPHRCAAALPSPRHAVVIPTPYFTHPLPSWLLPAPTPAPESCTQNSYSSAESTKFCQLRGHHAFVESLKKARFKKPWPPMMGAGLPGAGNPLEASSADDLQGVAPRHTASETSVLYTTNI